MNIPKRASRHHFMRRSWLAPKAFTHSGGGGAFTVADSATAFSVEPSAGALAGGSGRGRRRGWGIRRPAWPGRL